MERQWWKEAVAYQIYPRSFMDSNGDGIGDLQGILSKLDYLQDLGIDVIWICPVYPSPNDDNGYDISNFKGIMNEFGTMEDFDELLNEIHKRGMRLIMDLVINHTSDEHPWFIESKSSKDSPYRDFYIWHPGKDGKEPNNWASIFEGSAWEYDEETEEYYMHIFSRKQPDLNWENEAVREALYEMVNWWLDKGIDGFRIDAISHIKKAPGLYDLPNPEQKDYVCSFDGHRNQEGIQTYLEELNQQTFSRYDIMTVGEANGVSVEEANEWVGEKDGKFNMIFQFEHTDLWGKEGRKSLDIHALKHIFTKWQTALDGSGWNALFLENHDLPRSVSVWGNDEKYHTASSKCLAAFYFLMQGTPFIYQGQEIGMTNVHFPSIDDYDDVAAKNLYQHEKANGKTHEAVMEAIWHCGRDNSRTPMQWSPEKNAGFTSGTPWIKVNPNYSRLNVEESMARNNSIYHFYKQLIQLRKDHPALVYGSYQLELPDHDQIFAYSRSFEGQTFVVITNLTETDAPFSEAFVKGRASELCLSNYERAGLEEAVLQPFEARVYRLRETLI
ncbi:alpha-glucosidase [Halobacillus andaensis]|uniref:Alpha-amylase n=1 Tax=Halobacillus andaensis TaxID=1176239 RepID=A0A917B9L8_HALAA|nr:alpha-glucosidase [Halobacillus andaensis]MBP2005140.1 glycosidase [Halobacillus andaensis]GGF29140.1 alpha-glucosidase [Halobacillus andaensis]